MTILLSVCRTQTDPHRGEVVGQGFARPPCWRAGSRPPSTHVGFGRGEAELNEPDFGFLFAILAGRLVGKMLIKDDAMHQFGVLHRPAAVHTQRKQGVGVQLW
jgi:hypothetical protein